MTTIARTPPHPRQRKRRRRLLRVLLLQFLKRLQKACETLDTPAEWYEITQELRKTIAEYQDVLSSADKDTLWLATVLTDQTHEGITRACSVLQSKLVSVIATLPAGGLLAPLALTAAGIVTVLVVGAAILLNVTSVTVRLHNVGCAPILVAGNLPISLPGMEFPALVGTNAVESATVPPVTITTRFRPPDVLEANLFGAPVSFRFPSNVSSLTFDGLELTNGTRSVNLGQGSEHDLIVRCQ
jgi:hypothetical protein